MTPTTESPRDLSGTHGFDFLTGSWRVHHTVKRTTGDWWEFDGTSVNRSLMDGSANVEDNTFYKPTGITHGVALRAYDVKTNQWAIWWLDSRDPLGPHDPPQVGRFEAGIGLFYSDFLENGAPMRLRFLWSEITPVSARWEQSTSADGDKTWQPNWIMEFRRSE